MTAEKILKRVEDIIINYDKNTAERKLSTLRAFISTIKDDEETPPQT